MLFAQFYFYNKIQQLYQLELQSKKNRPTHIWLANSLHMFRQLPSLRRRVLLPPDAVAGAAAADDDAFAFAKPLKREIRQRITINSYQTYVH